MAERRNVKTKTESDEDQLDEYSQRLVLDRDDLDSALLEQSDLFFRVGGKLAFAISDRDETKLQLEQAMVSADQALRARHDKREQKYTEKSLSAEIESDGDVMELRGKLLQRSALVGRWGALKEAMDQRSKALRDLANLYGSNYFVRSSASSSINRKDDKDAEEARTRGGEVRRKVMKE